MDGKDSERFVIIHGHFYQPPRENPWTGRIDRQESATPYHDWNERICRECYVSNARSRRLDGYGRVTNLVNNYEYLSYNFGPTLFSWIEEKCPELYGQIVGADLARADGRGGHGNAIAQVYNHMIMPLAVPGDQLTQVIWGVRDFERRFGRSPEGIWLAETAMNESVLEMLIDRGFRFIILSPFQAERIRPLDRSSGWKSIADGTIPTGRVYRCYGARRKGRTSRRRFIDIFFYDARISTDISFNHLLYSGDRLAGEIAAAYERAGGDLVTIATDGEVYGHHEPFGDMALAYLFETAGKKHGLTFTNFAAYLDDHEPSYEVQIKQGENGEGTAWSCSHGVGRWKEDCGCSTGSPEGWNQKWRAHLREALDALRDDLAAIFERDMTSILKDPWKARNEYIELSGRGGKESTEEFMKNHASRELSAEEITSALSLLESQRNAMLMFTSCGWFFNDISGIEAVQLMKYAARAIELAGAKHAGEVENRFLARMEKALSNIPEAGTGKDIYLNSKKYSSIDPSFLAGQYALTSHLGCLDSPGTIFGWEVASSEVHSIEMDNVSVRTGRLQLDSRITLESHDFQYMIVLGDSSRVTCMLKEYSGDTGYERVKEYLASLPEDSARSEIIRAAAEHFGGHVFSMRDLFPEDKERILGSLAVRQMDSVAGLFLDIYLENRDLLRLYSETSLDPPRSLVLPARSVLSKRLHEEVSKWEKSLETSGFDGIKEIISEAEYYGIRIDRSEVSTLFTDFFLEKVNRLREGLDASLTERLLEFADYCAGINIEIAQHDIQNELFDIMQTRLEDILAGIEAGEAEPEEIEAAASLLRLARRFNFNTDPWQERLPDPPRGVV